MKNNVTAAKVAQGTAVNAANQAADELQKKLDALTAQADKLESAYKIIQEEVRKIHIERNRLQMQIAQELSPYKMGEHVELSGVACNGKYEVCYIDLYKECKIRVDFWPLTKKGKPRKKSADGIKTAMFKGGKQVSGNFEIKRVTA